MGLSRDQILAGRTLPREVVNVPELSGDVIIQGMSGTERQEYEQSVVKIDADGKRQINNDHARGRLLVFCLRDEDGRLIFTVEDIPQVDGIRADALDRMFAPAQRLCGLGDGGVDSELAKRLRANPSRRFVFSLARELKCTVGELLEKISSRELSEWMALAELEAKEQELIAGGMSREAAREAVWNTTAELT